MLRLKVISQWCDLKTELDGAFTSLVNGEDTNLNLLRRSVVFWKRGKAEARPDKRWETRSRVLLNSEELEQLGDTFDRTYAAILSQSPTGRKVACTHVQVAMRIVDLAHARSKTDTELLALVAKAGAFSLRRGLNNAARIEACRRGLLK